MDEILTVILGVMLGYAPGAIVIAIILYDLFFTKKNTGVSGKVVIVFILSAYQVSCWNLSDGFNSAFGNSNEFSELTFLLLFIVGIWFFICFIKYLIKNYDPK